MRLRSAGKLPSPSSPSENSRITSSPSSKSDLQVQQHHQRLPSPQSSTSLSLSSPPDSDDLDDPFTEETAAPKKSSLKRAIDRLDVPQNAAPSMKTTVQGQPPIKKRKVHFQAEDADQIPIQTQSHLQGEVFLEGLDAPFRVTGQSIFAKSDHSGEQKAWSRKYRADEVERADAIKSRQEAKLKAALGPDLSRSRASTPASFVSNTPSRRGRGNGRRGRGRGGRGGRGRGGGKAGRNEDSPEPKKKILSEDQKEILADLKARQAELKKFFKEVGSRQIEALNLLAIRDLNRVAKKSKAHENVAEYEAVMRALNERKKEVQDLAEQRYDYELQQASILLDAEKEVIEQRYKAKAKSEHQAGAQGDYLIAREAVQAMVDDNRTEAGSLDPTCSPRLHSFAEPGMVRGYYSHRISDETSLRRPLSSFDDAIRREITDQKIISLNLFKALDLPSANPTKASKQPAHQVGVESSPSATPRDDQRLDIQALAAEAISRLNEPSDAPAAHPRASHPPLLPAPPGPKDPDLGSWPLSRLADAAENESMRMKPPQNNHWPGFIPSEPFQPWLETRPADQRSIPAPPRSYNMPPIIQWQPQIQQPPLPRPPLHHQQPPSANTAPHRSPTHPPPQQQQQKLQPLPPPPPPHQHQQKLQPSPQFIHHYHQQPRGPHQQHQVPPAHFSPPLHHQQQNLHHQHLHQLPPALPQPQSQPRPLPRPANNLPGQQPTTHQNAPPPQHQSHSLLPPLIQQRPHPRNETQPQPQPQLQQQHHPQSQAQPPPKGGQRLLLPKKR